MTTWKEGNLLREAEESKTCWRWHSKEAFNIFGDKYVIALGAPNKNGKFRAYLKNSSHFNMEEYANFPSRKAAEEFAAKAGFDVEEDGEAYIARFYIVDCVEVDTEYGKCLVSKSFYNNYKEKLEWLKLDKSEQKRLIADNFKQDLKDNLCKRIKNSYDRYDGDFARAKSFIKTLIKEQGRDEAAKVVDRIVLGKDDDISWGPGRALVYYMTFYYPEKLDEVFSDESKIADKMIELMKAGILKAHTSYKRSYLRGLDPKFL